MERRDGLSRRDALAALGGAAATATVGTAGATAADSAGVSLGRSADGLVRATVGYADADGETAVRELAGEVVYEFAFDALAVRLAPGDLATLRARGDVRYAERDGVYRVLDQTLPWGIDRVDADVAHGAGDAGAGAHVAVVDTGIDAEHPDLRANLGEGAAFSGGARHDQWQDDNGHGTHCAGIVGAVDDDEGVVGVAPAATLHAVKVVSAPGAGLSSDVAKGIEWVGDQGYDVASISLGGDHLESVQEACRYAADRGVTIVAAAGNEGPCEDCVRYPAAYEECIAVSGTTRDDDLMESSSQGPEVALAAPGADVYSTYLGGYTTLSGTSMACPHVSGAAAQLAARGDSRSEIRERLQETAEDVGLSSRAAGDGLLDVAAALGHDGGSGGDGDEGAADDGSDASDGDGTPTGSATRTPSDGASGGARGSADVGGSGSAGTGQQTPTDTAADGGAPGGTPTTTSGGTSPTGGGGESASPATPDPDGGGGLGDLLGGIGDALGAIGDAIVDAVGGLLS